jgi:hypothetical protein
LHFIEFFGRAQVYQLPIRKNRLKESVSMHLRGRILFGDDLTYKYLAERFASGAIIKKTLLTNEFTYDDFRARYGSDAIPLFILSDRGELMIVTADSNVSPSPGQTVIVLVNPAGQAATGND